MFETKIAEISAKRTAIDFIIFEYRPPLIWNDEIRKIQSIYWKIHGFTIAKMESIRKEKELIEEMELNSIVNMKYNPSIEFHKMILIELEKLEEKDLKNEMV
jgi:hypothetical protein